MAKKKSTSSCRLRGKRFCWLEPRDSAGRYAKKGRKTRNCRTPHRTSKGRFC